MAEFKWPEPGERTLIGKRISRVDGPAKVSGRAKYTYDYNPQSLLYGKCVRCPYPHARIVSIDTTAAEKMPGVKAVHIIQKAGKEVFWVGDEVAAVAAVDEATAEDAARAVKVEYQQLPFNVSDSEPPPGAAESQGPLSMDDLGDMLDNQVPERQINALIGQYGITFQPTEELLKKAKQEDVPDSVIEALRKAPVHPDTGNKPHSYYQKNAEQVVGDPNQAFASAEVISEGLYGIPVITHCCLETHGSAAEWPGKDKLLVHISTQNLSGMPGQYATPLGIAAGNVRVHQDNIGGGFGSKFAPDRWGLATAHLSRTADGKPVKMMLERDHELEVAGARPSAYARVKVAAKRDGTLVGWQSDSWGTGGPGGTGSPPLPYVFTDVPNRRSQHTSIRTNQGPARAWRAPSHPQAAVITMGALDDLAARLNMDPVAFLQKNLDLAGPRAPIYREELPIAAELMDWKNKWHPRGDRAAGPVKRGLGVSMHTWGGRGHNSDCDLTLHPDGSVEVRLGTQDLGTGTRTAIMIVAADTLGLPLNAINLKIGDTEYPPSGPSGGSTTIGGVSASTRRAALMALDGLFERVAPALGAQASQLEAVGGTVRVKGNAGRALSWKQACAKLGAMPLTVRGKNPGEGTLGSSGVGGVQMADVSVDTETGVVTINKMVAVQDCGMIVNLKTAESQCYGALIMGISYALYEEKILDPVSGRMLNPNMEFYRLAGLRDVGELVVHMMSNPSNDSRGVIGLGEPPVISPGAAISNAVANAIGVRVPFLPLTPDRVLAALEQNRKAGA